MTTPSNSGTPSGGQGNPGAGNGAGQGSNQGANGPGSSASGGGDAGTGGDAQGILGSVLGDNSDSGDGDGDANANLSVEEQLEKANAEARKWKDLSRKNEQRAKANNAAATKLHEIEDQNKTETQRALDRAQRAETAAAEATSQTHRLLAAAQHGLGPDLVDFLGSGSEEDIFARGETLAAAVKTAAAAYVQELQQNGGGLGGVNGNGFPRNRPVESLRPGGTPMGDVRTGGDASTVFRNLLNSNRNR